MTKIRMANRNDVSKILEIYSPYVKETTISFENEPPSLIEMQSRVEEVQQQFPWLVLEVDEEVVGYAYASSYKSRCAYAWSAETTIYVKKDFCAKGLGVKLYNVLLERLTQMGVVNVIAGIALPNAQSVALHEKLGFKQVAQFKDIGFKLNRWIDVGYWQLQLDKPLVPRLKPNFIKDEPCL